LAQPRDVVGLIAAVLAASASMGWVALILLASSAAVGVAAYVAKNLMTKTAA
jgi:hypothetical protein